AIVKAMKAAVPCPVSVKTRLGWVKDTDCLEFVKVVADAGADLISMHGRTREQGYAGTANWQRVGEARANVAHLPFLVNGDITSVESAKEAMTQSGADGVLIGRGLLGNPWFAKQVEAYLEDGSRIEPPTLEQRIEVIRRHAKLQLEHYGDHGLTKLRKHLPWYFKHDPKYKPLKEKLVRISSLAELEEIFEQARGL
ncbi:MAG: tRNA-dihydrouridine synthase, partial [Candidatus Magasanikbacteria bacterium]|nr:tRNA-dihydrouridine synthase [Candidatus Magasanikbacteria bacterium]